MGRKPVLADRRSQQLKILLAYEEQNEITAFAASNNIPAATWAREVLMAAVRTEQAIPTVPGADSPSTPESIADTKCEASTETSTVVPKIIPLAIFRTLQCEPPNRYHSLRQNAIPAMPSPPPKPFPTPEQFQQFRAEEESRQLRLYGRSIS